MMRGIAWSPRAWCRILILADYQLHDGRTGPEAIEVVREEVNEEVTAIIVTGDTAPDRLSEARALGAPLLHEPVVADALYRCIDAVLVERYAFSRLAGRPS